MNEVVSHEAARFVRLTHHLPTCNQQWYLGCTVINHDPMGKLRFLAREIGLLLGQLSMSDKAEEVQRAFEEVDAEVNCD